MTIFLGQFYFEIHWFLFGWLYLLVQFILDLHWNYLCRPINTIDIFWTKRLANYTTTTRFPLKYIADNLVWLEIKVIVYDCLVFEKVRVSSPFVRSYLVFALWMPANLAIRQVGWLYLTWLVFAYDSLTIALSSRVHPTNRVYPYISRISRICTWFVFAYDFNRDWNTMAV